jgi:GntR family transcriptional regulator
MPFTHYKGRRAEFKKGVGTFIRGDVLEYDMRSLVSFTDKATAAGKKPSTRVVRFEQIGAQEADTEAAASLRLRGDEKLYYMERIRAADGVPVIYERRHVIASSCADLSKKDVAGSLYALWIERYALEIDGADGTIRAVSIRGVDAKALKVAEGDAGLLVIATGLLRDDRALWYERTLYRGDAYEFRSRLGGVCPARPVVGTLRTQ